MNWGKCVRKRSWPNRCTIADILLERLKKNTEYPSEDSPVSWPRFELRPFRIRVYGVTAKPTHSVSAPSEMLNRNIELSLMSVTDITAIGNGQSQLVYD
jgi:hypothetical protein